jgi:phenylalanyl-tRNA synthetase beta chain
LRGGALDPKAKKAYDIGTECLALEVDLDSFREDVPKGIHVVPLPKFPAARRDLALVVPEGRTASEIEGAICESGGEHLIEVALFDLYQGKNLSPGHRSLAWRLSFQASDRTLTDAEVNERVSEIVKILQTRYAVALR